MLDKLNLAIVDVETTGCIAAEDRIIELGIHRIEQGRKVDSFSTLVNPQRSIPSSISRLTGITDHDVEEAPTFYAIHGQVKRLLQDCIFVAHNAPFDYGFIRNEFERLSYPFTADCLCSVKLSRLLFPRHHRHGLDSLIERFDIACPNRHRALDDASVIWAFLQHVQKTVDRLRVSRAVNALIRKPALPASLPEEQLAQLPSKPGAYVFYDGGGRALFVGCGSDLCERVRNELARDAVSDKPRFAQVTRIESQTTYGRLGAEVLALHLRQTLKPLHGPKRVRPAASRRPKAWPYPGPVLFEESLFDKTAGHLFIVNRWCLQHLLRYDEAGVREWFSSDEAMYAESYGLLQKLIGKASSRARLINRKELEQLIGP